MPIKRRKVLYLLACASGWPVVKSGTASAEMTEHFAGESILSASQAPSHGETASSESLPVERVLGIGGLFFRAHDPKALAQWYRSHLGVGLIPGGTGQSSWQTEAGPPPFHRFLLRVNTSVIRIKCGWLTFASEPSTKWRHSFVPRAS